ncbi:MAG: DUF11 domain-containing protein, partial [Planctomycetaceae bacterium]|nr:DUF11 domain-containing protein [Planctomycetaceae bacterium]
MQRILDVFQRARERVSAKIAILVIVGLIGVIAVWQGFSHMAAQAPAGPKKQVATGTQGLLDRGSVRQAGAEVADGQMPGAGGVASAGGEYGQSPAAPGEFNPYASGSLYQPETSVPENPYRATVGDDAQPAQPPARPATSPYAAGGQSADESGGQPAEGASDAATGTSEDGSTTTAPVVDPVEAYAQKFKKQASAAKQHEPAEPRTVAAPPATSAAADLTSSPYSQPATSPYSASAVPAESTPAAAAPAETPPTRSTLGTGAGSYSTGNDRLGPSPYSQPSAAAHAVAGQAAATPGERQLEGPQQPAITIEKFSPAEIQVGKPATFELIVRNVGQVPAQHVVVTDHVPAGTQLADVRPQPAQNSDGSLVWQLGTMQPGEEAAISLQVMPQSEGEIGSTAHVTFAAQATSRSICTRPQLTVEHTAPPKVLIGESLTVGITVANPGTGPATGVMIEEDVPDGLAHVAGRQLEYEVGTLRPGESKRLELALKADKPGLIENTIVVRGDGNLAASHRVQVEVVAPQLEVDVSGPKKRFLQRQATYTVSVANPGTAPARTVELVAYLPRGMKFVESDSQGQYDSTQHAVFWSLEELPVSKAGSVKLTTLPVEPGEQRLRIEGKADLGLTVSGEQIVQVEQSAELLHTVKDADEVIEVGSETAYLIKVSNVGTKAATNVRVVALLPAGIKGTAGEGPTRASGDATQVIFEPLAKLEPQEEVTFKVLAQGVVAGDHIVRVQLASDEWPTPVTREESTRV